VAGEHFATEEDALQTSGRRWVRMTGFFEEPNWAIIFDVRAESTGELS
jgi:hypothetical protein